jgi:hypothetical protein
MLSGVFKDNREPGSGEGANSRGCVRRIGRAASLDFSCRFGDCWFRITSRSNARPVSTGISWQFLASPPSLILPSRRAPRRNPTSLAFRY